MGAANMTWPGADLIAFYLNPDRLPVEGRWSRKQHAQRRLCQRFAAPVNQAVPSPARRNAVAWSMAARVARVSLSALSNMKS
jgi:hypothetical protein